MDKDQQIRELSGWSSVEQASVLLVDDRADKLLALETLLQDMTPRIVTAMSGADALRLLLREDFAVILLDVSMPGMDGFETASLIRQRPKSQHTPIIFVTSINTNETHVTRGYSLGAVDYIFSPIEPEILRTKVGVFIDLHEKTQRITEQAEQLRKQAEERAVRLEHRLEHLLNTLGIGIFRLAPAGTLVEANPAFVQLLGADSIEDIQSRGLDAFNIASYSGREQIIAAPKNSRDVEIRRKDGRKLWAQVSYRVAESEIGEVHLEGMLEDISERKRNEERLQELNETLERRVEERAKALRESQEHLRRAERLASLGTLAAGIAHEINNPLNSILMTTEFALAREREPAVMLESMKIISEETKRCGRIIKGILQFSRNEKKERMLADLNATVQQAAELVRTYVRLPLSLTLQFSSEPIEIHQNATEIEQVIINIIQNSAAVCSGEAKVVLTTSRTQTHARLTIADNGPGIAPEIIDKIFDPFFSTRATEGGTGLGLSVAHGIVADHGGTIHIDSRLGEGATFTIEIPLPAEIPFTESYSRTFSEEVKQQQSGAK